MTVVLVTTIKQYSGLSTDQKPVPGVVFSDGTTLVASDVPIGSIFSEEDTGKVFQFGPSNFGINWYEKIHSLAAILGTISDQLAGLPEAIAAAAPQE